MEDATKTIDALMSSAAEINRMVRHDLVCRQSDTAHLRSTLMSAAALMDDIVMVLADDRTYDPGPLLRGQAQRCRLAAKGKS